MRRAFAHFNALQQHLHMRSSTLPVSSSLTESEIGRLNSLSVPISKNERKRLSVLKSSHLMEGVVKADGENENKFDRLTKLAARYFKVPMAVINVVDIDMCVVLSHTNFPFEKYDRNLSICTYAILEDAPDVYIIENTLKSTFEQHPFVVGPYCLRFYAAAPIYWDGLKVGTFCILDSTPHEGFSTPKNIALLQDFAGLVTDAVKDHLDTLRALEKQKAHLLVGGLYNLSLPLSNINALYSEMKQIVSDLHQVPERDGGTTPEPSSPKPQYYHSPNGRHSIHKHIKSVDHEELGTVTEEGKANVEGPYIPKTIIKLSKRFSTLTHLTLTEEGGSGGSGEIKIPLNPCCSQKSSPNGLPTTSSWKQYLHCKKQSLIMKLALFQPALIVLSQQIECNIQLMLILSSEELQLPFLCEMESLTKGEVSYYLNVVLKTQFPYLKFRWEDDLIEEPASKAKDDDKLLRIPWDALLKILHYSLLSTITTNPSLTHSLLSSSSSTISPNDDQKKWLGISTDSCSCIRSELIGCILPASSAVKRHHQHTLQVHIIHYYDYPSLSTRNRSSSKQDTDLLQPLLDWSPVMGGSRKHAQSPTSSSTKDIADFGMKQPTTLVTTALTYSNTVTQLIHAYCHVGQNEVLSSTSTNPTSTVKTNTNGQHCLVDYSIVLEAKRCMYEELMCNLYHTNARNVQGYYKTLSRAEVIQVLSEKTRIMEGKKEQDFMLFEGSRITLPCEICTCGCGITPRSEEDGTSSMIGNLLHLPKESFKSDVTDMTTHTISNVIIPRVLVPPVDDHSTIANSETTCPSSSQPLKTRSRMERSVLLHDQSFKSIHTRKHVNNSNPSIPSISSNSSLPRSAGAVSPINDLLDTIPSEDDHNTLKPAATKRSKSSRYTFESLLLFPTILARTFLANNNPHYGLTSFRSSSSGDSVSHQNEPLPMENGNPLDHLICSPVRPKYVPTPIPAPLSTDASSSVALFHTIEHSSGMHYEEGDNEGEPSHRGSHRGEKNGKRRGFSVMTSETTGRCRSEGQLHQEDQGSGKSSGGTVYRLGLAPRSMGPLDFQKAWHSFLHIFNPTMRHHRSQAQEPHGSFPAVAPLHST